eukprot:TRINITY_DN4223_c0_g1_i1.p1 TRINITY_DN4223_c0_g1~~TRINITY_DN4223_c0_g1_i1.p1  ORF type:complete len:223 (+),score=52.53 TRINITY_DN4223_c0_g1_i1:114-782(+)
MKQRRPWQRVLYRDQGYADDYVDPDYFLSGLVTNAHFKRYDYWQVVRQSAVVSQQVSAVGVFVAVYVNLVANVVSARALFAADAVLLLMGCLIVVLATNPSRLAHLEQLLESARPLAILFAALFALSPMLATLTASFSSDTIYSTSTLLVILHLYTHNYCDSKEKPAPAPVAVGGERRGPPPVCLTAPQRGSRQLRIARQPVRNYLCQPSARVAIAHTAARV